MASPKPIKEFKEKVTVKPQSVKVVKPKPDITRKAINAMETTRTTVTKSGALAKTTAARVEMRNSGTKPAVVSVRSTPGISGKGGAMVGGLYKPMGGGGMNWQNK